MDLTEISSGWAVPCTWSLDALSEQYTFQWQMAWPCFKNDGVCIVVLALEFAINLMASFSTTAISNTIGSVRLYGRTDRAICTATWIYFKTTSTTPGPTQSWQNFMSYRMSHSIILCWGIILSLWSRGLLGWHGASFFRVGYASARSNNFSCTLKGMSWNALGHWTLKFYWCGGCLKLLRRYLSPLELLCLVKSFHG